MRCMLLIGYKHNSYNHKIKLKGILDVNNSSQRISYA